jgi:mycofactocin system glycosyltransferase
VVVKRFVVDPSWLRCENVVFAGSPVTKFALTERGRNVAIAIEQGEEVQPDALVRRLLAVGAIHPVPLPGLFALSDVTAVIPALVTTDGELDTLRRLVTSLGAVHRVVVVDDSSPIEPDVIDGASVVCTDRRLGPAAARNEGLRHVDTSFVLFVDLDVEVSHDAVQRLLDHMVDDDIALVAPRVLTTDADDVISRYERARSPLDMGGTEANVRKGTRVSYVPSTTWLCRTAALRAIGGFDETLRTGEDVDAVWRLADAGFVVRYEPGITVSHQARPNLHCFVTQRLGYGESAAPLSARHGDAIAPVRMNPVLLGAWITAIFSPVTAALIMVTDIVRLTRALTTTPDERKAFARLATRNFAHSAALLARAITRVWWPIALVLALISKRARVVLAVASLLPAAFDWSKNRPALDPLRFTALRILDDISHGAGVWRGVLRHKQVQPVSIALGRSTRYREDG